MATTTEPAQWLSPVGDCDMCHKPLTPTGVIIDGATSFGPWALMCPPCHATYGRGLGTGSGQQYERTDDGRWLKVEG